jgi:glycosyltransferase involved in cell wall biosynthesis
MYVKDLAKRFLSQGHSVHIGFLGEASDTGRSIVFENAFLAELRSAGVNYFFVGHNSRKFPWMGAIRVRRYVRDENIDVYHAHLTYGIVFGALLDIPRIYTHHNAKMRVNRFIFKVLKRWVDQFVAISDLCGRLLAEYAGRNITVIRNGVDIGKISQKRVILDGPESTIRCVAVGAITKQKNYNLLVSAVARIPASVRSRLTISIAGEGSQVETENLVKTIAEAGLKGSIELLGNVDDIPALLDRSHLFAMSSAWEGLPIALIEAASAGLPCIVIDVGGCREVIDTCRNGLVVAPGNVQALADAIESLVREPSKLTEYSDNALTHASEFSIERACEEHLTLYEEVSRV